MPKQSTVIVKAGALVKWTTAKGEVELAEVLGTSRDRKLVRIRVLRTGLRLWTSPHSLRTNQVLLSLSKEHLNGNSNPRGKYRPG